MFIEYCMKQSSLVYKSFAFLCISLVSISTVYSGDKPTLPESHVLVITIPESTDVVLPTICLSQQAQHLAGIIESFKNVRLKKEVTDLLQQQPANTVSTLNKAAKRALKNKGQPQDSGTTFTQQFLTLVQPALEESYRKKGEARDVEHQHKLDMIKKDRRNNVWIGWVSNGIGTVLLGSLVGFSCLMAAHGKCIP